MYSPIILASSSPFRKQILDKLQITYTTNSPDIDESPARNETPIQLVHRLSKEKAKVVADKHAEAIVIGSDQVAIITNQDGIEEILGKPGNYDNAFQQLSKLSGKTVTFLTGLSVQRSCDNVEKTLVEPFEVTFKSLTEAEISNYLKIEEPYNCAGSFKSEALGITLFEKLNGNDPNTLIGLPLIKLTQILIELNHHPLLMQK